RFPISAIRALISVEDEINSVCYQAPDAWGRCVRHGHAAISGIIHPLIGRCSYVRRRAVYTLGLLHCGSEAPPPGRGERIIDEAEAIRQLAKEALSRVRPQVAAVLPALGKALRNNKDATRYSLRFALARGPFRDDPAV